MSKKITPTDSYKHNEDKRLLIPTSERAGEEGAMVDSKTASYNQFKHDFDRGRDPELYWLNKYANDNEETQSPDLKVDIRSLYVHEDIQPEMLINNLAKIKEEKANSNQTDLFSEFEPETGNVLNDELEQLAGYYSHEMSWKNRLIQGDSLLVMNSLLNREGMAGKVQMVYMDPPYGIKYGGNWQNKLNSREVKDNDESISSEPEMVKAFRDTWELGIHSYLSYLRDRLIIARELLHESGSVFVQISDENVQLVRNLLDETFGSENFVSQIVYQKTSGAGSPGELLAPASVCDYIVWYAKDLQKLKYNKLFLPKEFGGDGSSPYQSIELADGKRMSIADWEKLNNTKFEYKNKPRGSKVFTLDNLTSSSGGENARFPIEYKGKIYTINHGSWKTSKEGIEVLKSLNRIDVSNQGRLGYIRYFDDFLMKPLTCLWTDAVSSFMADKLYVVQSTKKAVQRCVLMCTDPGDLILDPTCGSGTTAIVAEQWGRRWITIDTSRIALNIAKKRLTIAQYPYYSLFEEDNIRYGFKYNTTPHIKLKDLANKENKAEEILYDQPEVDKSRIRVSGPFTVETLQSFVTTDPQAIDTEVCEAEENRIFQERVFAHLQASGIRNGDKKEAAVFTTIDPCASPYLNAKGYYTADGEERIAYFHIGPKFGTVSKVEVNEAIKEFRAIANKDPFVKWLVILGFSFEDNINDKDYNFNTFTVSKVRMHDDLMQDGLLKKDKGAGSFITIGEPDIQLIKDSEKDCHIEILGLDIYDPIKDVVNARSVADIAYWEIDDNYDGSQFIVRGIHFCGGDKKEFDAWKKGLLSVAPQKAKKNAERTLRLEFNDEVWEHLYDFKSEKIPFVPGRKVAVRVISQFGEESTKVITMELPKPLSKSEGVHYHIDHMDVHDSTVKIEHLQ